MGFLVYAKASNQWILHFPQVLLNSIHNNIIYNNVEQFEEVNIYIYASGAHEENFFWHSKSIYICSNILFIIIFVSITFKNFLTKRISDNEAAISTKWFFIMKLLFSSIQCKFYSGYYVNNFKMFDQNPLFKFPNWNISNSYTTRRRLFSVCCFGLTIFITNTPTKIWKHYITCHVLYYISVWFSNRKTLVNLPINFYV